MLTALNSVDEPRSQISYSKDANKELAPKLGRFRYTNIL